MVFTPPPPPAIFRFMEHCPFCLPLSNDSSHSTSSKLTKIGEWEMNEILSIPKELPLIHSFNSYQNRLAHLFIPFSYQNVVYLPINLQIPQVIDMFHNIQRQFSPNSPRPVYSPHYSLILDPQHYAQITNPDFDIIVWTVNTEDHLQQLLNLPFKITGIISDYPQEVFRWLLKRNTSDTPFFLSNGLLNHRYFEVHGHRFVRSQATGNSLPGFELSLHMGLSAIEGDLIMTKDEKLIFSHDMYLTSEHCACIPGGSHCPKESHFSVAISSLTQSEIQSSFYCNKTNDSFKESRLDTTIHCPLSYIYAKNKGLYNPYVPLSLDQVFDFFAFYKLDRRHFFDRIKDFKFNIELKSSSGEVKFADLNTHNYVDKELLVKTLANNYMSHFPANHKVVLQSFDFSVNFYLAKYLPHIPVSLLQLFSIQHNELDKSVFQYLPTEPLPEHFL